MPEEKSEESIVEELKRLGTELTAVADDKLAREAKLKEVESVLSNLKVKDFPDLADSLTIQSFVKMFGGDLGPGQTKHKGTLAQVEHEWTLQDIYNEVGAGHMTMKTFIPNENIPITFNGVTIYITANEECTIPECFYNIYREHLNATKQANINEKYLMGLSDVPPHPNWDTPEGATVRAWSTQGRPYGRVSGSIGVGRIREEE